MSRIKVIGKCLLKGEIELQGSKNAVLPILAATILNDGITVLNRCPNIKDVSDIIWLLKSLNCEVKTDTGRLIIDSREAKYKDICCREARASRSGVFFMGAMLGKFKKAQIPYPGGCSIGLRPIDIHINALRRMQAHIFEKNDEKNSRCLMCETSGLEGCRIRLHYPSVGATENIILAAVLAKGRTIIENPAKEPEIYDLCDYLVSAGADIRYSRSIIIEGVDKLHGCEYTIPGDRIAAGTYMTAVAAAGGYLKLNGVIPEELSIPMNYLETAGCEISYNTDSLSICRDTELKAVTGIVTRPYPGFPTDLQSQFVAAFTQAEGESRITEGIFEQRYKTINELIRMGADIRIINGTACIKGAVKLKGCEVEAYDLRGGAALIIAAVTAEGVTYIDGADYIKRGYEDICRDFRKLGVDIDYC